MFQSLASWCVNGIVTLLRSDIFAKPCGIDLRFGGKNPSKEPTFSGEVLGKGSRQGKEIEEVDDFSVVWP